MVNSIVFIVHRGWIRPHDGARILRSCASIIGMPLSKGMPTNALAITGLIKSNDAARGHHLLVEAFGSFGDIVDASIAPINRGFGKYDSLISIQYHLWHVLTICYFFYIFMHSSLFNVMCLLRYPPPPRVCKICKIRVCCCGMEKAPCVRN